MGWLDDDGSKTSSECAQMKNLSIIFVVGLVSLTGCKKFELEDMKDPSQFVSIGAVSDSSYKNLVWQDEFDGTSFDGDPRECFDDDSKATCVRRLDWDAQAPCTQSISHLKQLNKCRWAIWDGFSFWEKSFNVAYKPSQIKVEGGKLKLRYKVRPGTDGPFLCGPSNRDPNSVDYYDDNCKVLTGGIYSRDFSNGKTQGRSFTNGRIEVRARVDLSTGAWPAIWMWEGTVGSGTPYPYNSSMGRDYIGEIDILEIVAKRDRETTSDALQTYHVWHFDTDEHYQMGASTPIDATQWNVYGVERTGDELKYYINGAYIKSIHEGDLDSKNNPTMRVDDTARFMILSLGIAKDAAMAANPNLENALFEVDWVRSYQ